MYTHQLISILVLLISWPSCDGNISGFDSRLNILSARRATELTADQRRELQGNLNVLKSLLGSVNVEQAIQNVKESSEKLNDNRLVELTKSILGYQEARPQRAARNAMDVSENNNNSSANSTLELENEISHISRLVSYGYNLIRGFPEGEDAGIRTLNPIFKFTFHKGKNDSHFDSSHSVPDQVAYIPGTKTVNSSDSIYSGGKSYRDALISAVHTPGSHKAFQFSASEAIIAMHHEAVSAQALFLDRKTTLTVGEVRYQHDDESLEHDITDEFYEAVMNLPATFWLPPNEKQKYYDFFEQWGTDIIQRAEVGQQHIMRYKANYTTAYQFARSTCGNAIDAGDVGMGNVKLNIEKLSGMITPDSEFGNYETEMEYGTDVAPVPIRLHLQPITAALDRKFWKARFGDGLTNASAAQEYIYLNLRQKSMKTELNQYAKKFGFALKDPDISIPIEWPRGTYSLPQTTSGCPAHFSSGCRTQDNEDTNNQNFFSQDIEKVLKGEFHNSHENIQTCYCTKTKETDSIFSWMPGRYCINRKGGTCPEGFSTGYIEWDDENTNNINSVSGVLPDGKYPESLTIVHYCCRDDGETEDQILLPNTQPLVLFPYKQAVCQEVHGMTHEQHFVYMDDEDSDNQGKCVGKTPFVPNACAGPDIKLTFCYYWPT